MTGVTPTDRPKSVRNRCVIEGFVGVFVVALFFVIFLWAYGRCHGTESDLFFFLFIHTRTSDTNVNLDISSRMMK